MSVLWERHTNGTHYSVRQAGASVRLYTNGVYHTQWNPKKPLAGAVWDCLSLPVLYRTVESTKRILLLGLGGGAVVRQLEILCDFDELMAIELDPNHVFIAQEWFGVNNSNTQIILADAIKWIKQYKGPPFDLIIDDLFFEKNGEPERAQALNSAWLKKLSNLLEEEGLLVINTVHRSELDQTTPIFRRLGFEQGVRLSVPQYDNAIGVISKRALSKEHWFAQLKSSQLSAPMKRQAVAVKRRQFFTSR
ncbi:MAG: class I SAM-dependent methyltransferase [Gammaproteobacteria bacterium]|nr:class I SAM-dependent methyltransferase [Gammaproteobacteria bacterium]